MSLSVEVPPGPLGGAAESRHLPLLASILLVAAQLPHNTYSNQYITADDTSSPYKSKE